MKDEGIEKLIKFIDFQKMKMEEIFKRIDKFEASLDEEEEENYASN